MSVRIGVQIQPQHADFDVMLDAFRQADELGVDTIYTWDHFYPLYGDPDGTHWEALTTLTAMAAVTSRARIGGLVFCNSYRNPQLLADAHRTIDHLSNGRVILGIGAGWAERDYHEYGYEFGTTPERLRALRRDLPLMKERLTKLNPPPTHEIPFLIGGTGEKVTLRLVAEYAQMWHGFTDGLENYHHKVAVLAEHCAAVGRDPASIDHVIGTQGDVSELAEPLADAGVAEITTGIGGEANAYALGKLRELLAWRDEYNRTH